MAHEETILCEFCGAPMCQFFADVDASALIRASVVTHFSRCSARPSIFSDEALITYASILVEAYKRKRAFRMSRGHRAAE